MITFFKKRSAIGYLIKIASIVVMGWGVLQAIFFLVVASQTGAYMYDEFGGMMGQQFELTGTALFGFIGIIATHALYGLLIMGFGEVIDLLQDIYFQMNPDAKKRWEQEQELRKEKKGYVTENGEIPLYVEKEIKDFYLGKEETAESIFNTSDRDVYRVLVNGRTEYVELGGFQPRVLSDEEANKYE